MKNKRVVVLGAGQEIDFFVRELYDTINIVAFGVDVSNKASALETIKFCESHNIPVIGSYTEINSFNPDVVFMVSYPKLIPKTYLDKYKFINVHGALIPAFRGIHGGTWAIINGEKYHGFSVHLVDEGIDSGPVFFQARTEMLITDNILTIREKIFELFKANIKNVFLKILSGGLIAKAQDESKAIYVCRRKPEDGLIDWNMKSWDVFNLIRALTPPYSKGAYTYYKGEELIISEAQIYESPMYISVCGQVAARFDGIGVLVKCGDGVLMIKKVIYRNLQYNATTFFKSVGVRLC